MTNKNVLIVATLASFIDFFEKNDIKILQDMGYQVHLAANYNNEYGKDYYSSFRNLGVITHQIEFKRSPFSPYNISIIKNIKEIINSYQFQLIHCHTPVGGVIARLAARNSRKEGTKVVYSVHGLQFCKGESIKNWILFYPIEKFLSRYCDAIISINKEDYSLIKRKFNNTKTYYIPGVGIDTQKVSSTVVDVRKKRKELGISDADYMVFSSGELTKRKNHQIIIRALHLLNDPNIHYFIAGEGPMKNNLIELAGRLHMSSQVHLLGFREDIYHLLKSADIFAFPSVHEGFGISLLEAMSIGLPCTATAVQGINDLLTNKDLLHKWNDCEGFSQSIECLIHDKILYAKESKNNSEYAQRFDIKIIDKIMRNIYQEILKDQDL